jgi:hypothetical protein
MGLRALAKSRAAVGCTLLGAVAVGAVFAVGWRLAMALRASAVTAHPLFLGGFGQLIYLIALLVLVALLTLVWYPFGAGVAYAVGRQARGGNATLVGSLRAVRNAVVPLARWLKTLVAIGPVAERVRSENDVGQNEVAAGCEKFVVAAIMLDSPTDLAHAVERANRLPPEPGRERVLFAGIGGTTVVVAAAGVGGYLVPSLPSSTAVSLSLGLAVVGVVVTAAVDAAWRAQAYASADVP